MPDVPPFKRSVMDLYQGGSGSSRLGHYRRPHSRRNDGGQCLDLMTGHEMLTTLVPELGVDGSALAPR
jgi:hypothetical protein